MNTAMNSATQNSDVILAHEFQKHLSNASLKNGVVNKEKNIKQEIKQRWEKQEYHVKEDDDVTHKGGKIFCYTTQFTLLLFCGPHAKPHGIPGLNNHYNMQLYPKLGHSTCETC